MRLAVYYDIVTGRNDGNPLYVYAALKRRQEQKLLEVDHLAPMENVNLFGKYDANIWVDWGEDALGFLIPYKMIDCPKPSIYWCSDTHIQIGDNNSYPYRLQMAKKFDKVFVAQKRALEEFKRDGVEAEWLPHAFEPQAYHDLDNLDEKGTPLPFESLIKEYDVSFVGHVTSQNRIDFLDHMFKEFPNFFWGQRRFQDAAKIYSKSKIVLNIAMTDDVNMRCFEVTGSKACLLTNWLPTIEELGFEDGKTCILYKNFDEAVDKVKYYLKNDSERERIAQAGFEMTMSRHTIDHRVDKILEAAKQFQLALV